MVKAGTRVAIAAAVAAGLIAQPAAAQELSDKSVKTFMEYAWQMVPAQFTKPDGKTVQIDKKKKDEVVVPMDLAREIIRVGRVSAHAQICELKEDQYLNYNSLMRRETDKKKWSDQQLIYINMLHLTTVMLLTGNIKLVEKDGDKEVVVEDSKKAPPTCTAEQKTKVKELIAAYVAAGPKLNLTAPAATGATGSTAPAAAPAPAAAAAPAPAEKKK
jgi:hypothetical protein